MAQVQQGHSMGAASEEFQLKPRLGTLAISFLVVSAAAPLTVIVNSGLAFHFGGIGAPGAMLASGIALILFSLGLTAMSRHVRNAGAFYAYASKGFGKLVGIGVAMVTTFSYAVLVISFYTWLGYFAAASVKDLVGPDIPWFIYAFIGIAIVGFLCYRDIEIGVKVIAVLLIAEITILVCLAIAVLIQGGPEPLSAVSFTPYNTFLAPGAGTLFVLGFGSYLGFESTVLYAEEARDPRRNVPYATYIAVAFLALFYAFMFWILTAAFGVDGLMKVMNSDHFSEAAFNAMGDYLGPAAESVTRVLIVTSFLACVLAFHNACTRYIFSLGREGLLPRALGKTHKTMKTPHRASLAVSIFAAVILILSIIFNIDPYTQLSIWTYSAGVIGLVFSQALAAASVVGYFRSDRKGYSVWRVQVAPALGALALFTGVFLIVSNFSVISGLEGLPNWLMIGPTPLLLVVGIICGVVMKHHNPERYRTLNEISSYE